MDDGADAVAHLRGGRRRTVAEVGGVGDVVDDVGARAVGQLAGKQQGVQRIHEAGNAGGGGVIRRQPRADVERDRAVAGGEAGQAIGVVAVVEDATLEKIHLIGHAGVAGQLKFRRGQAGGGEHARKFVIREIKIKHGGRTQRRLREVAVAGAGHIRRADVPGVPLHQDVAGAGHGRGDQRIKNLSILRAVVAVGGHGDIEVGWIRHQRDLVGGVGRVASLDEIDEDRIAGVQSVHLRGDEVGVGFVLNGESAAGQFREQATAIAGGGVGRGHRKIISRGTGGDHLV